MTRIINVMKLSPLRAAKALWSLAALVRDPNRLGQVFEMSDAIATPETITPVVDALARDPRAALALEERHRFTITLAELRRLPPGTLGREFADHMIANHLDPSALPDLPSTDRLSFFRAHLYESHDIWHVVTGFGTDWKGEIGLQAFYTAQIPGPLPSMLVAVGALRVAIYEPDETIPLYDEIVRGYTMGRDASPLFGVKWDELWDVPLEDVRRALGITPAGAIALAA
jgi:ubiquinone biosynthesis protein COQ4